VNKTATDLWKKDLLTEGRDWAVGNQGKKEKAGDFAIELNPEKRKSRLGI